MHSIKSLASGQQKKYPQEKRVSSGLYFLQTHMTTFASRGHTRSRASPTTRTLCWERVAGVVKRRWVLFQFWGELKFQQQFESTGKQ